MESNHAQQLLQQLRIDYLHELPSLCDEIESLVLTLAETFSANYEELYRRVHSMKGSGGVHGLSVITTICHNLEGLLSDLVEDGRGVSPNDTRMLLSYVDLIRKVQAHACAGGSDFQSIENELGQIRQQVLEDLYPIILVEPSRIIAQLCAEALKELPVKLSIVDDGLEALTELLRNQYSMLITANEAKTLNGLALASALRLSDSPNRNIKTALLTSKSELTAAESDNVDYLVHRDTELVDSLARIVSDAISEKAELSKLAKS